MLKQNDSYESAYNELQGLLESIESGEIPVGALTEKVSRAGELIRFCQDKLRTVEAELSELYEEE